MNESELDKMLSETAYIGGIIGACTRIGEAINEHDSVISQLRAAMEALHRLNDECHEKLEDLRGRRLAMEALEGIAEHAGIELQEIANG